jgi:hypothetical protein
VLQPQRINPQSTGLLDCPAGGILRRPNVVHMALHVLSQEAQLICEHFEKGLHAVAIMWQTEDLGGVSKNHRVEWNTFLQGEKLSETSLLRDFKIICKTGGPPSYARCIITEGDVSNGLSLVENYLLSRVTPEEAESMEVLIHNHCGQDLTAWIAESGLRKVSVTMEPYQDLHWSCCAFPERRPELLVKCVGDDIQLLLLKHVWPFRSALPGWHGGYFNLRTFEPAEKNVADSHFIRYTPAFAVSQLQDYLHSLEDTVMQFSVDGVIPATTMDILQSTPWLQRK